MGLVAYPVRGKQKSVDICNAFIAGARDARDGAVFYGVNASNVSVLQSRQKSGAPFYYIDNAYFDATRGRRFRVTKNAIQHSGLGESTGERFAALNLSIAPWHATGEHIVVCPQSSPFMHDVIGYSGDWLSQTIAKLLKVTTRSLRVREWNRDKIAAARSLPEDLLNAWCLVTHSSAAAVTALLHGVPVVSEAGAAACMSIQIKEIEEPVVPPDRERFFGVLADNEFTLTEMESGYAWRMIG
jgi:hypothetical protein